MSGIRAHITLSQAITDTKTFDHSITENDEKTMRIIWLRKGEQGNYDKIQGDGSVLTKPKTEKR